MEGGVLVMQRFCRRKADIAFRLGLHPDQITYEQMEAYDEGEMEVAETCDWPRLPPCSVSSGPYFTAPLVNSVRPYTVWPVPGGAFPDDEQWPGMPSTLLEEGSAPSDR
jgi:hypothetical protein